MIRRLLLAGAFAFCGLAAVQMVGETRMALRAGEPVAETLGVADARQPLIALVPQERDCAGADALIGRWHANRPTGMAVRVPVVGKPHVADALRDRLPAEVTVGSLDVRSGALLGAKLGYRSTPFAVLLDARGRLAGTSPGTRNLPASAIQALVEGGQAGT